MTDAAVVAELGRRVATHRLGRNLTQSAFADEAGVGRSTIQRLEGGDSIQLSSFIKILRALDRVDAVEVLLSPDARSPLAELERQRSRRQRARRAEARTEPADASRSAEVPAPEWTWGDEL